MTVGIDSRNHSAPTTVITTRAQLRPLRMKIRNMIHNPASTRQKTTTIATVTRNSARTWSMSSAG